MARLGFQLPVDDQISPTEMAEWAQLAESKGYDSVWAGESWGRDAFSSITHIAARTSRIRLGTGIVTIFSRTPALIAQTAATIDEISNGRLILGLGTSAPAVIENWHGLKYDRPLQRMREYIDIIRLALSGERVNYDGQIFQLRNFRMGIRPVQQRIPIYVASLGPQTIRLTGEIADGWVPVFVSPRQSNLLTDDLAQGASKAGRAMSDIDFAAYVPALIIDDIPQAKSLLRQHLAHYIGGMGTFYANLVTRYGFGDTVSAVVDAWSKGDRKGAAEAVSDALLDTLSVVGTAEDGQRKLTEYRAAGVNHPVIGFPHGASSAMIRETIERLAPDRTLR